MEVDIDLLDYILQNMGLKHRRSLLCIRAYLTKNTGGPVSGRSFSYNGHFHIVEHFEVTVLSLKYSKIKMRIAAACLTLK